MSKSTYNIYFMNDDNEKENFGVKEGDFTEDELNQICSWNSDKYGLNLEWEMDEDAETKRFIDKFEKRREARS